MYCKLEINVGTVPQPIFYLFDATSFIQTNKEVEYWISLTKEQAIFTTTIPFFCSEETKIKTWLETVHKVCCITTP